MFDLSKREIYVTCSVCNKKHVATLKDVTNGKIIHCTCGTNIRLTDNQGSVKKGISDVNSQMKKLQDTFKKLGRR